MQVAGALEETPGRFAVRLACTAHRSGPGCRREIIAPGYTIAWLPAATPQVEVEVMVFVGDPASESVEPDLPRALQVRYVATGKEFLGSSHEYNQTILAQFGHKGISDPELGVGGRGRGRGAGGHNGVRAELFAASDTFLPLGWGEEDCTCT